MPRITLTLEKRLLTAARALATAKGTTFNALVRKLLADALAKEAQREEARLGLIELMKSPVGGLLVISRIDRDEIYGGPLLPRNK